jgi:hypothetical protein
MANLAETAFPGQHFPDDRAGPALADQLDCLVELGTELWVMGHSLEDIE